MLVSNIIFSGIAHLMGSKSTTWPWRVTFEFEFQGQISLPVNYIVPSRWEMKDLKILFVENCQLIPKLVKVLKSGHKQKSYGSKNGTRCGKKKPKMKISRSSSVRVCGGRLRSKGHVFLVLCLVQCCWNFWNRTFSIKVMALRKVPRNWKNMKNNRIQLHFGHNFVLDMYRTS